MEFLLAVLLGNVVAAFKDLVAVGMLDKLGVTLEDLGILMVPLDRGLYLVYLAFQTSSLWFLSMVRSYLFHDSTKLLVLGIGVAHWSSVVANVLYGVFPDLAIQAFPGLDQLLVGVDFGTILVGATLLEPLLLPGPVRRCN